MIFSEDIMTFSPLCQLIMDATVYKLEVKYNLIDTLMMKDNLMFVIFFLEEFRRSRYSRIYREYCDMLPSTTHTYPIFFDDEEMAELNGSPFSQMIE